MNIELFYNQNFLVKKKVETKEGGKLKREYIDGGVYIGGLFTPGVDRTVRWGKQDFVVSKNLYCSVDVDIELGDRVIIDEKEFDVIFLEDTNNQQHHYFIGLTSR